MARRLAYTFVAKDKFTRVASAVDRKTRGLRKQFRGLSRDLDKTGKKIQGLGRKTRAFSVASALLIGGSAKVFGDLESNVTNVLTLLNDDKAIKKFGSGINVLARDSLKLGFATDEAGQALFNQVSQLGANASSFKAFKEAQELAIAGVTQLDVSVAGIANIMNVYGKTTTDAREVANAFFTSQKAGSTDVAKLASNVGKVSSIAKDAGIGFKELLATMAQLTQGGLSTEEATTALRAAIISMTTSTGEAAGILEHFGVPFDKTTFRAMGLTDAMRQLNKVNKEYPNFLAKAIPEVRAMSAVTSLSEEGLDRIGNTVRRVGQDMKNGTGKAAAFKMQMSTFNRQMKMTKGEVLLAAEALGKEMVPAIKLITRIVIAATNWFIKLSGTTRTIIGTVVALFAAIAPVLTAIGTVMVVLGKGAAFAGAIFSSVALAIVGAIAAVVVGIVLLIKHWDAMIEKIKGIKNLATGFFGKMFGGGGEFGSGDLNVTGNGTISQSQKSEHILSINAPKGVIGSIKSVTSGESTGLKTGVNLREQS